jgi:hypothetical protein
MNKLTWEPFTPDSLHALCALGEARCPKQGEPDDPRARRWLRIFCFWSLLLELRGKGGTSQPRGVAYGTTPPGRFALRKLRTRELAVRRLDGSYRLVDPGGKAYLAAVKGAWRWLCRNALPLSEADRESLKKWGYRP